MIQGKKLLTGLLEIKKVIQRDPIRGYGGVFLFDGDESGNWIVGTDGFRLVKHEIGEMPVELIGTILNYNQMLMLIQMLRIEPITLHVEVLENELNINTVKFTSRSMALELIKSAVQYPNYKSVIPNYVTTTVICLDTKKEKEDYLRKIKEAISESNITKTINLTDEISINGKYLLDAISGNSATRITWKGKEDAIVITKGDNAKGRTITVLVPVKEN